DGRDELEVSIRAAGSRDQRHRACGLHPRGHRDQELLAGYSIRRSTRAGTPAATENSGMSSVTTELAPITDRRPTVTPPVITTFAPHQTLSPTRVGPLLVKPCQGTGLSGSSKRWSASVTKQPLANMQCSPISTSSAAATITPRLRNVPPPILIRAGAGAVSHTPGSNRV